MFWVDGLILWSEQTKLRVDPSQLHARSKPQPLAFHWVSAPLSWGRPRQPAYGGGRKLTAAVRRVILHLYSYSAAFPLTPWY